jgi:signal transduction histidine kinase
MAGAGKLDVQAVLDGLGQGVLLFSSDGKLLLDNLAARNMLGTDLNLIRDNGWSAATALFNTKQTNPDHMIEAVRDRALETSRPVRFFTYRSGEHMPCWAAAVQGDGGAVNTMITLDAPDWTAVSALLETFRSEMKDAIESTQGHIDLIGQTMKHHKPEAKVDDLTKRISGFTRLVSIHMHRVGRLMDMLERLENIRTGKMRELAREGRKKIDVANYLEDFIEELDELSLIDPETEPSDQRSRLTVDSGDGLTVNASSQYLTRILHDILRNAIMYSIKATPIKINVHQNNKNIQFDVVDEGYGIREKERERVFDAFQRARQPQIIAEFGYGLSLHLCKHEVEAMNGRMWFESEEGVGTTFSFHLPMWQDESASESASSDSTT